MTQEAKAVPKVATDAEPVENRKLIGYAVLDENGNVAAWPFTNLKSAQRTAEIIRGHRVVGLLAVPAPCDECPTCPECLRPGYMMPECGFNGGVDHHALAQWHGEGHPEPRA